MKKLTVLPFILFLFSAVYAQEVQNIIYRLDCPEDWQDSLMRLQTDPAMELFCSSTHSTVVTNSPFAQSVDSRIMDLPSWTQKTAEGYWVQYQGEEADSALVAYSFTTVGKPKKTEAILGHATKKIESRSPAFSKEKIEITYTEDIIGVHPWCPNLRGVPLRIVIPTEMGNYILEAEKINRRVLADIPSSPRAQIKAEIGQEVKENYFYDNDSTSLIVFGLVRDEFTGHALGMVDIKVFEKEKLIQTTRTDIRGVYDMRLKVGGVYSIEIGTAPYVTKRLHLDLLTMRAKGDNPLLELDGSIFTNPKNIDCTLLKSPILKMFYDMNTKEIGFDTNYNDSRREQLRLLLEQIK